MSAQTAVESSLGKRKAIVKEEVDQSSYLSCIKSRRVMQWKTYTQTDRKAQLDTQNGSRLEPV